MGTSVHLPWWSPTAHHQPCPPPGDICRAQPCQILGMVELRAGSLGAPQSLPPPQTCPLPLEVCGAEGETTLGLAPPRQGLLGTHRRRGREIGCLMNVSCVYGEPASYDNPDVSCLSASAKSNLLAKSGSHHDAAHRGFNPAARGSGRPPVHGVCAGRDRPSPLGLVPVHGQTQGAKLSPKAATSWAARAVMGVSLLVRDGDLQDVVLCGEAGRAQVGAGWEDVTLLSAHPC